MATTIAATVNDVAEGVLALVSKSQQIVIDQVTAAGARASEVAGSIELPQTLPFAESIGSPAQYVEQGFALAGRILEVQKDFVLKLARAAEGLVTEPADN